MQKNDEVEARLNAWKQRGVSKEQIIRELAESCIDWPYVYAANGEMCTPEWRKNRMGVSNEKYSKAIHDACPVLNGSKKQEIGFAAVVDDAGVAAYQAPAVKSSSCSGCKWEGCRCFDCQGFVHWLLSKVGVPFYGAGATTQWTTASNWAVSGEIKNMPSDMVCCLYKYKDGKMSHAGMSMGDGNGGVIHCSTVVKRGNIKTDRPAWTHWGIPKGLYSVAALESAGLHVNASDNIPILRRGSTGETVIELQKILNEKHQAGLTVDGNYGKKTEDAVKTFQASNRLTADGVVGPKTRMAQGLYFDENISAPIETDLQNNTEIIWNALFAEIKNPYGVAGVMGNLEAESSLTPNNLNNNGNRMLGMTDSEYTAAVDKGDYASDRFAADGYAYGLAQWCYRTRKAALLAYAKSKGVSVGNLQMQLEYLIKELRSYKSVWAALTTATTVREASNAVLHDFEKPANQSENVEEGRANRGMKYFSLYAKDYAVQTEAKGVKQMADYKARVAAQSGSTVNMRCGPSTVAKVLKAIPIGTVVNVTYEQDDDWAEININGMTGYMMKKFLERITDAEAEEDHSDADAVTIVLSTAAARDLFTALRTSLGV